MATMDKERMLLLTVDPSAAERVARLAYAIDLLRAGRSRLDVRCAVQQRFQISQPTAWRITSMAVDLTEPVS